MPLALLFAALLFWPLHASAQTNEAILFAKNKTAATVRGQVSSTTKTYTFRARKGQRTTITLAPDGGDKANLTFTVYAYCGEEFGKPLVSESLHWQDTLPCSDRYSIDVTPSRNAMQVARAQRYALTVEILP